MRATIKTVIINGDNTKLAILDTMIKLGKFYNDVVLQSDDIIITKHERITKIYMPFTYTNTKCKIEGLDLLSTTI